MRLMNGLCTSASSLATSPPGRLLLGLFALYLIALSYFRSASARDPTSLFVNPDAAYRSVYSAHRINQSNNYIAQVDGATTKAGSDPLLCVTVGTVEREGVSYFSTVIGSLLDGLSDAERQEISIIVFIANTDPTEHRAYNQTWLRNVTDHVKTEDDDTSMPKSLKQHFADLEGQHGTTTSHKEKALWDYSHTLGLCHSETNAPYALVVEDDVIAARGWYDHVRKAIERWRAEPDYERGLYLRFFYTEEFLGWHAESWRLYLTYSIAVELTIAAVLVWLRRASPQRVARILTPSLVAAILVIFVPAFVGLFFAAGPCTVAPLPIGIQKLNADACCSQALLFPREKIPGLRAYYAQHKSGYRDTLADEYGRLHNFDRWALKPSLFQHIGSISSKDDPRSVNVRKFGRRAAELVWNYEFEDFDPVIGAANQDPWTDIGSAMDW